MIRWEEENAARPEESRRAVKRGLFTNTTMTLLLNLDRLMSYGRRDPNRSVGPRRVPNSDRPRGTPT